MGVDRFAPSGDEKQAGGRREAGRKGRRGRRKDGLCCAPHAAWAQLRRPEDGPRAPDSERGRVWTGAGGGRSG